jgi:hypothetical protein
MADDPPAPAFVVPEDVTAAVIRLVPFVGAKARAGIGPSEDLAFVLSKRLYEYEQNPQSYAHELAAFRQQQRWTPAKMGALSTLIGALRKGDTVEQSALLMLKPARTLENEVSPKDLVAHLAWGSALTAALLLARWTGLYYGPPGDPPPTFATLRRNSMTALLVKQSPEKHTWQWRINPLSVEKDPLYKNKDVLERVAKVLREDGRPPEGNEYTNYVLLLARLCYLTAIEDDKPAPRELCRVYPYGERPERPVKQDTDVKTCEIWQDPSVVARIRVPFPTLKVGDSANMADLMAAICEPPRYPLEFFLRSDSDPTIEAGLAAFLDSIIAAPDEPLSVHFME